MKNILTLLFFVTLLSGCGTTNSTPSPVPVNMNEFSAFVDESVGCSAYHPGAEDIGFSIEDTNILTLTANVLQKPGLFIDAIAAKNNIDFQDNSTYTLSGEFRKVEGSNAEQIDANLQYIDSAATEYRAEIIWYLNPYSPNYGDLAIRLQDDAPIAKYHLGDDSNWHTFSITTIYVSNPETRTYKSMSADGHAFEINSPAGTLKKNYKDNFAILLETHNMNTNCDSSLTFSATSQWRNITIVRTPILNQQDIQDQGN